MKLRVGTRGSRLALIQTEMICSAIKAVRPDIEPEIKIVTTDGDKILDRPIAEIGGKGVFVDNIETMLLNREIDIAVHSGKDIPSIISDDFFLKAIVPRADDRDVYYDVSAIRSFQTCDHTEYRGFSASARTEKCYQASLLYSETDIL